MNIMTSLQALSYLDDIAHGRKMIYDAHSLALQIAQDLEVLEIIKKYVDFKETDDDLFNYFVEDKQYVSNRSDNIITRKEYEKVKEVLKR